MQTFEMSNQSDDARRAWWSPRASMLLGGAHAAVSIVILVITILVLVGQEAGDQKDVSLSPSSQNSRSTFDESDQAVLERFPGYFRTHKEQEMLEGSIRYNKPVNDTIDSANCTIGLEKSRDTPWCDLTSAGDFFHSCCISRIKFDSPGYKVDNNEVLRKLAVFGDYKQFFRTETCKQVIGCSFCLCGVEESIYTGVYDTEEVGSNTRYGVTVFKFDGCCKCF